MDWNYVQKLVEDTDYDNVYYSELYSILESNLNEKREKWTTYQFNGMNVPRTTEIINATINKEYLNKWAAKLGDRYKREMDTILDTGSMTHAMIEDYIVTGRIKEKYPEFQFADPLKSLKAYHNFLNFWKDMKAKGFTITPLAIELPFVTPWYGGTIDFIARITDSNGVSKVFILDFKTSGKISYNYFLQLEMYWQAMNFITTNYEFCNKPFSEQLRSDLLLISGIGIIRVDKQRDTYEYQLAHLDRDWEFLLDLNNAASSMVNWYYQMQYLDTQYIQFKKDYIERGGIYGIYR